jgi:hypothetical protein
MMPAQALDFKYSCQAVAEHFEQRLTSEICYQNSSHLPRWNFTWGPVASAYQTHVEADHCEQRPEPKNSLTLRCHSWGQSVALSISMALNVLP